MVCIACGNSDISLKNKELLVSVASETGRHPISPLPQHSLALDVEVSLGARLFHDTRLSKNQQISCASCHIVTAGGDDNRPVSVGIEGRIGNINAPTVLNSGLNFRQFWDGRAASLEDQIEGPIHNDIEMGANWPLIIGRLKLDSYYSRTFEKLYRDGITAANIKSAIANFERALITPNSPFDRYLEGNQNALTAIQKRGYENFRSLGCISCHQGINIGGNMYQRIGVIGDYFGDRGKVTEADYGLYNHTKREEDRYKFKVPSLRNVAITAPYFHDGQTTTLKQAIFKMAYYQLGESLNEDQILSLEAFLISLTGETNPLLFTAEHATR